MVKYNQDLIFIIGGKQNGKVTNKVWIIDFSTEEIREGEHPQVA